MIEAVLFGLVAVLLLGLGSDAGRQARQARQEARAEAWARYEAWEEGQ